MPFEISPEFKPQTITLPRYQHLADALLAGCKVTRPTVCRLYDERLSAWVPWLKPRACALGALLIGMGRNMGRVEGLYEEGVADMRTAYALRYGRFIEMDNDSRAHTREQIAARIAAL